MAHQQQGTTVTTVYTTSPQAGTYPVVSRSVQQYEITFQPKDIRACLMNGMAQLIIGCLCVIFGIVQICITCYYGEEAVPIWCGFWFILSGLCGISVGRYVGFMAQKSVTRFTWLSSLASSFAITLLVFMSIAVSREPYYIDPYDLVPNRRTRVAIDGVVVALACLEFLLSIHGACMARRTWGQADRKPVATGQAGMTTVPAAYPAATGTAAYPQYGNGVAYPPPQTQYGFANVQSYPGSETAPPPSYTYSQPPPSYSAENKP